MNQMNCLTASKSFHKALGRCFSQARFGFVFLIALASTNQPVWAESDQPSFWAFESSEPFKSVQVTSDYSKGRSVVRIAGAKQLLQPESIAMAESDQALSWDDQDLLITLLDPSHQFYVEQTPDAESGFKIQIFIQPSDPELSLDGLSLTGRPSMSALTGAAAYRWLGKSTASQSGLDSIEREKNILLNTIESSLISENPR